MEELFCPVRRSYASQSELGISTLNTLALDDECCIFQAFSQEIAAIITGSGIICIAAGAQRGHWHVFEITPFHII